MQDRAFHSSRKVYFFCSNSEETIKQDLNHGDKVLAIMNPNQFNYHFCIFTNELFLIKIKGKNFIIKIPFVYVLNSLYPFHHFFNRVLHSLINEIRLRKMQDYLDWSSQTAKKKLKNFDGDFTWRNINQILPMFYLEAKDFCAPNFNERITNHLFSSSIDLIVPSKKEAIHFEGAYCLSAIIHLIPETHLIFIFISILTEKSVIFVSENRSLVSFAIRSFLSLLSPLNFVYPVIYSITKKLLDIFEAVVPIIGGK